MPKIVTENFRVENAKKFHDSFSDANTVYYVMASDLNNPEGTPISNTQKDKRTFLSRVIFGNKVGSADVKYMFSKNDWVANTVYDSFDDEQDVETLNMHVTVLTGAYGESAYHVFKCIRNNSGAPSSIIPSTSGMENNVEIELADGYVWKYMLEVVAAEYTQYGTTTLLPYVPEASVIASAEESVSDIIVESAIDKQFAAFDIGDAFISTVELDGLTGTTYKVTITTTKEPRSSSGAYMNMYLRIIDPGQAESVYDIQGSEVINTTSMVVYVDSAVDLTTVTPSLSTKVCKIVPKIDTSLTVGDPCISYGEVDSEGTLVSIQFVDKGTEYKSATSILALPSAISDVTPLTTIRAIISPRGGHGSDPISELYMSSVGVVTEFESGVSTNIPDSNTYTKIGLVLDPEFANTSPTSLDNRLVITLDGDVTSIVEPGHYLIQEVNDESVTAIVHEASYDGVELETILHMVNYDGDTVSSFVAGAATTKTSLDATSSDSVTINTISSDKYIAYTGELLHFIDFDEIERQQDRVEKAKFVFDF